MNILVIKQTSLGDALHATPHLRAIKAKYPDAHLTVLTASNSAEIYQHNPHIDRLVLFDYPQFKQNGFAQAGRSIKLIKHTLGELKTRKYDLAFDLQGLARSVIFLYLTKAKQKFAKGRWLGLKGFRNKQLHAIDEMSQVLAVANIPVANQGMEFGLAPNTQAALKLKLSALKVKPPYIVISPFTRWASKNWPLEHFMQTAKRLCETHTVLITGTAQDKTLIEPVLPTPSQPNSVLNVAGAFSLAELACLMSDAALVISGDSFPMHLATAVNAPLITLFGPTDENKTGPRSENSAVLRPQDCQRCAKPNCPKACLNQISVETVIKQTEIILN
ncbi:MAG: glycosyltransferase family 9 protein [Arenicellales bacterium]